MHSPRSTSDDSREEHLRAYGDPRSPTHRLPSATSRTTTNSYSLKWYATLRDAAAAFRNSGRAASPRPASTIAIASR